MKKSTAAFTFGSKANSKKSAPESKDKLTMNDVSLDHPGLKEIEERRLKRLADQSRQDDKIEVNHYVVLVFDSHAQMKEFTSHPQLKDIKVLYGMYFDGEEFASKIGLKVSPTGLPAHKVSPTKSWAEMVNEEAIEQAYQRKISKNTKISSKKSLR